MTEQVQNDQQERDPVLDLEVSLRMKVEDVNVLLSLLSKLPYAEVAPVINAIRNDVIGQVQEQQAASAQEGSAE